MKSQYPILRDKSWLIEQYWSIGRSAREIAEELGCSSKTVYSAMHMHGIPVCKQRHKDRRHVQGLMNTGRVRYPLLHSQDWLRRMYHDRGMTCAEIAEIIGCSVPGVSYALGKHGLRRQSNVTRRRDDRGRKRDLRAIRDGGRWRVPPDLAQTLGLPTSKGRAITEEARP